MGEEWEWEKRRRDEGTKGQMREEWEWEKGRRDEVVEVLLGKPVFWFYFCGVDTVP